MYGIDLILCFATFFQAKSGSGKSSTKSRNEKRRLKQRGEKPVSHEPVEEALERFSMNEKVSLASGAWLENPGGVMLYQGSSKVEKASPSTAKTRDDILIARLTQVEDSKLDSARAAVASPKVNKATGGWGSGWDSPDKPTDARCKANEWRVGGSTW